MFTHSIADLELPGPLPFTFERAYSSTASKQDQGLGFGWAHSLGWFVEVFRTRVRVWNEKGVSVSFPIPQIGHSILGDWGWVIRRELWGFAVDANDDVWRIFSVSFDEGATFRLTAIEDRNKNRIALTYDDGKLVEIKDSAGRTIKVTSTKQGRIASIEVKNSENHGQWIAFGRYQYDDLGRLVRVTDADDYSWTYEYDQYNRLVRDTDRVGLSFCFRYDEKDRGIEAWGEYAGKKDPSLADDVPEFLADGTTRAKGIYHRKFDYHPRGYTEVTDTTETRRYHGNKKGLLDKAVTGGRVTNSSYDDRGFELTKTNGLGATTTWRRDARGRVEERVDPLGHRTRFEHDAHGLVSRVVDPAGGVWTATRDSRGNLELLRDPAGGTTSETHDDRGLVTTMVEPTGGFNRYDYDSHGNRVGIERPNSAKWSMAYDAFGRRLSFRDATGAETRYVYSARGDLTAKYDPYGEVTRYRYDGEQHLVEVTNPTGYVSRYRWGGFHQLCGWTDAKGHTVHIAYDREGEPAQIVNANGELHRFYYDNAGYLTSEQTFDGRTVVYRYDAAGRRIRIEDDAGYATKLAYDAAGHLVSRILPDETEEVYEYNVRGELISAKNDTGRVTLERDALGRIVGEIHATPSGESWIRALLDTSGRRVARSTSRGFVERIEREATGARARTWLGDERVDHVNDGLSREVNRYLSRGGVIESIFDRVGRLAERRVRSPIEGRPVGIDEPAWIGRRDDGITAFSTYAYDRDGRLSSKVDGKNGLTRYDHDPVGQLIAAIPENLPPSLFRYDPAGNIYENAPQTGNREYASGNRLVRNGATTYKWDSQGRLSEKHEAGYATARITTYSWNSNGLLARVESSSGQRIEFSYDVFSRRTRKVVFHRVDGEWRAARSTIFVWDGDVLVHEVRELIVEAGAIVTDERTYCFEDRTFVPIAHAQGGEWFHYENDAAGTVQRLVGADGRIASEAIHDVWGAPANGNAIDTPLGMAGHFRDDETGLDCVRHRYWDPAVERWISPDPLGIAVDLNVFRFDGSPPTDIDPLGLATKNGGLAGSTHPVTGVPFDSNGNPQFDSLHDVKLPKKMCSPDVSDGRQMRFATRNLRDHLADNPNLKKQFTKQQLADIAAGKKNIDGLTWHHDGDGRTLQLVDRDDHANTGHDGGRKATGGRS